ncbi:MAG: hypothetical protein IIY16_04900 [Oscillospiraceae bacterium]|nr:hypothetical protein [Oscillospiraceae bacterium]
MKRIFALLLAAVMLLTACAPQDERPKYPAAEDAPQSESPKPQEEPAAQRALESVQTLAAPKLPDIPAAPDWAEYDARISALNEENISEEERMEREAAIWEEYSAADAAHWDAVRALRGDAQTVPGDFSEFTLPLAEKLLASEENTVFSPANLWLALAMLAEVTDGESRAQILNLLGESDIDALREKAGRVWENLWNEDGEAKTLLANSLWVDAGYPHHADAVNALAEHYYASAHSADMGTDAANEALRAWLNENTGNLLEESVEELETSELTRLILASALYFKGAWSWEFNEAQTRDDIFTAADGTEQTVPFMHTATEQNVISGGGWTAATLPFQSRAGMTFILPNEGVETEAVLREALTAVLNDEAEPAVTNAEVHWSVPKFDVESKLQLPETLAQLGMTDVFSPKKADFSPFADPVPEAPLFVTQIEHAARVLINEEGCEAAAYTAIMVEAAACEAEPLPVIEMDLDRPFLFVITGLDGLPLFIGAVNTL